MDMKNLKKKILGAVFGVFAAISLTVPSYAAVCVSGSADSLQQDPHYKEVSEIAEGLSECMPNEAQKKYVYSVTMTRIFYAGKLFRPELPDFSAISSGDNAGNRGWPYKFLRSEPGHIRRRLADSTGMHLKMQAERRETIRRWYLKTDTSLYHRRF